MTRYLTDRPVETTERRDYYRLTDTVDVDYRVVSLADANSSRADQYFDLPAGFATLKDLHVLNLEANEMVRVLSEKDLEVGAFLSNVNKRVELLTRSVLDLPDLEAANVELCQGGISFLADALLLPDTCLALKMLLLPSCLGLTCFGVVRHSRLAEDSEKNIIGVQFLDLPGSDEKLIARHILRRQSEERRAELRASRFSP